MFHEDSDDHVDQDELGHQHEDDEEDGRDDMRHAAVLDAVLRVVAVLAQRVLHDAVPVVASGHAEQRQEGDAEVLEVGVLTQTLTRMLVVAFCKHKVWL